MAIQRKDKQTKKRNFEKLSLHPLKFEEAVREILKIKPENKKHEHNDI